MFIQRQCIATGCKALTAGYSTFCRKHKTAKARHGDPLQASVSATRLAPYLRRIQARYSANSGSAAWSMLAKRWAVIVEDALSTLEAYQQGAASVRHHVQAAEQVRTIATAVDPLKVVHVALAVYLIADVEPRAFRSDRGFDWQLVRRVRSLAPVNIGTTWNSKTGLMTRAYRDVPPRVTAVLAGQLKEAFGSAGLQLAGLERHRIDPKEAERQRLAEAIEALQ